MTLEEIEQCERLVDPYAERTQQWVLDPGGYALCAYWKGGGSRFFYSVWECEQKVADLADPFELTAKPEPAPHKPAAFANVATTQRKLLTGLDCLPGQGDLF